MYFGKQFLTEMSSLIVLFKFTQRKAEQVLSVLKQNQEVCSHIPACHAAQNLWQRKQWVGRVT